MIINDHQIFSTLWARNDLQSFRCIGSSLHPSILSSNHLSNIHSWFSGLIVWSAHKWNLLSYDRYPRPSPIHPSFTHSSIHPSVHISIHSTNHHSSSTQPSIRPSIQPSICPVRPPNHPFVHLNNLLQTNVSRQLAAVSRKIFFLNHFPFLSLDGQHVKGHNRSYSS